MTVDFLSCGTCFVTFRLSDINMFIEHKKASCCFLRSPFTSNLENNKCSSLLPSLTSSSLETPSSSSSSTTSSFSSSPPLMTLSCSNVMDNINNNNNNDNNHNTLLESQNSNTIFLKCVQCSRKFTTPWTFLMHVQVEHQLIFIDTIGKFSKTYEQQLKNTFTSNVEELLNETNVNNNDFNVDVDDNDEDDDDDDQCENGVLHTIDKLLSEKVNNSDSDTTITSPVTNDDNKCISPNNNNDNNNNNTNSTTVTPTITSNTAHTDNSSSTSINNNSHNASTQTYLTGIKQHSIPHRKRKYVSCCIGESTVTCNRLNNIKTCSNVKSCNLTLSSCCNNLSTGICPYNFNSNNNNNNDNSDNSNNNNNDNNSNGSSMNSDIFVSDYCCTTGSIICKPTTCSNLLNTNEIITQDTSRCTASTAIVSCCMRKLVCCTSTPVTLPICCDRSMQNEINNNNNFIIQETKTTNTARITCCPCSPKRSIISQSSEVQTDFDPEFSYSDYADLATLLNAATPTTITSPLNSILSPQLPLLSDIIIQQSLSPPTSPQQQNNDNDEYCQNIELHLKNDIINKPYINVVNNNSNFKINDNYLSSQIDHINNTNTDINNDNSIILNNSSSSSSSLSTITTTNVDIDVTMKSMPVSSGNTVITSNVNNNNDNMITSTANVIFQMPTIMHTNLIACPNIDNKSNNNNNNNVNKYYCDSIPPRRYICRDCGTSFRQNVHLRKHIMIQHTKVKPFSCPYCQYTTVEKSHLTVHIRTHTGERPFSCRECNYSSAQNCTLKSHYLRKHPTNLIKCNYCSELFFTELELTKHLRGCSLSFRQQ
ncbi:unnamed protein product [Schistosoma margrebowiei]|uniref:C2H2-type domain-containing protein n=1 Tax=Schistosoma margrebowiei TaxID=48269 RepID=A0AA85AKY4_9TREM|nr:unnamed protein product [Schistosoma margrebowiei]